METNIAIRSAIADQVHSPDDILPRLDVTKLTITEGKVVAGLVEQMDAIKDAIDYLGCNTKKVREYLMSLHEQLKKLREE